MRHSHAIRSPYTWCCFPVVSHANIYVAVCVISRALVVGTRRHNLTREKGETALHLAALAGEPECVLALIRANASPVSRDSDGNLPLHLAAFGALR